jgi:hypothetical protein
MVKPTLMSHLALGTAMLKVIENVRLVAEASWERGILVVEPGHEMLSILQVIGRLTRRPDHQFCKSVIGLIIADRHRVVMVALHRGLAKKGGRAMTSIARRLR